MRLNGHLYTSTVQVYCPASDSRSGEKKRSGPGISDNRVPSFVHWYATAMVLVSTPETLQVRL